MRIKNMLNEDDAVSPVIGVILMVAITVILAAVIASFVLGLGDTAGDVQPTTSFNVDFENSTAANDTLALSVADGDSIDPENMHLRGSLGNNTDNVDITFVELEDNGTFNTNNIKPEDVNYTGGATGDELTSGQGFEIEYPSDVDGSVHDFDIVWDTGDDSSTLDDSQGPNA